MLTFTEVYKDNGCLENKERNELVREGKGQGHQTLISSVGATNGIDKFSVIVQEVIRQILVI